MQIGFGEARESLLPPAGQDVALNGHQQHQNNSSQSTSQTTAASEIRHHSVLQPQHSSNLSGPAGSGSPREPLPVLMLSAADSRQPLVAAARLQSSPTGSDLQQCVSPRTTQQLADEITRAAGHWAAVQVDVLLVMGPCCTLAGFPPWALQFTQIYHLGLLAACKQVQVQQAFQRFWSTQQKFGK